MKLSAGRDFATKGKTSRGMGPVLGQPVKLSGKRGAVTIWRKTKRLTGQDAFTRVSANKGYAAGIDQV